MKKTILMTLIICSILTSNVAMPKGFTAAEEIRSNVNYISKMIKALQPELDKTERNRIAYSLFLTTRKYKIDPKLMIAIIGTESDFKNGKVSTTGDLSLAQINANIWNKEFVRIGRDSLNSKRLKKDEGYALSKMAEILIILKDRHAKNDDKWFARYHSQTTKYKNLYSAKVEKRLRIIASVN